jgi:AraC family transcriptional regulator, transcriptional activator of pobA
MLILNHNPMKNIPVRSIKSAEAKPDISESFKIRSVREVLSGKDMSQDLHRHDFYFVLALKKGDGDHEIDFVAHSISNDCLFFMRPGQVHRLSLKAKSEGYLMEFSKNFFRANGSHDLLRKAASQNFCQLGEDNSHKLQNILRSIHEEYTNRAEGFQEIIQANLSIFFIELTRHRRNHKNSIGNGNEYAQERLQDFLELLENRINGYKTVSHYADMLNLSPFQLNSITRTLLGKTAAGLIDDHILLEAKRYLLATSNQVNQIAYHLGYEDVSYFIRFFKKHTGYTPELFRQNFR